MEKRISQIILDLYQIREDPIENFSRIQTILETLDSFGLEFPEFARILEYRVDVERISEPLKESLSLRKCVERYISTEFLETDETRKLREFARQFHSEVSSHIQFLKDQSRLLRLKITEENRQMMEQLLQMLIGHRLEVELIPNLFEKKGYKGNTTTFKVSGKIMEIDGRYERDSYSGARSERLTKRDVVVVECTATIDLDEIKKFHTKVEIVKCKYIKDKDNWNYDYLNFEAWMVACYGWSEELLEEARSRSIIPITPAMLERELKKHGLLDRRIPTCPTAEPVS